MGSTTPKVTGCTTFDSISVFKRTRYHYGTCRFSFSVPVSDFKIAYTKHLYVCICRSTMCVVRNAEGDNYRELNANSREDKINESCEV